MRRRHFESLQPVCPLCRETDGRGWSPLEVAVSLREENENILEGILHCRDPECRREYPIIDGIPIIVPDVRKYVSEYIFHINMRHDLSAMSESLLGDCCGPGSPMDVTRQQLGCYAWSHYGDLDPQQDASDAGSGSLPALVDRALKDEPPRGPIIDLGCSVGRASFALADRCDDLVLGVDLNFSMLRLAAQVLHRRSVRYPRRRVGLVYDRREFPASFKNRENVDFWACDATALPFPTGGFATVAAFNLLDSIHSPADLLTSIVQALGPQGRMLLACPYDWSAGVTPVEAWIGGHSQRGPGEGASEPALRGAFMSSSMLGSDGALQIEREEDDLKWTVRMHDRSEVNYTVHLVVARKHD